MCLSGSNGHLEIRRVRSRLSVGEEGGATVYLRTLLALAALSEAVCAQEMDARTTRALNNVQHEMSTCYAYYNLMGQCIGNQDPALAQQSNKTAGHLIGS